MELPELQQGLQNIQQAQLPPDAAPAAEAPWLNMDNLMQGYGNWFDNDKGLGEMLLSQLRSHGVNTQAATEAMLRELLQGLVDDLNMLQQKLTGFTTAIAQQMQQTQAVADSVQSAIDSQQPNPTALQMQPPMGAVMPQMNDVPPDIGADFGAQPPAEQPPAEQPPAPDATLSDRNMKYIISDATMKQIKQAVCEKKKNKSSLKCDSNTKYTISDATMKQIKQAVCEKKNNNRSKLNSNILTACKGGF